MKAVWNNQTIAESDDLVQVEGNYYFPRSSVEDSYLIKSETQTSCPWKGTASYYSLKVDGKINTDALWYYNDPKPAASKIKDRVAFWKGVEIQA